MKGERLKLQDIVNGEYAPAKLNGEWVGSHEFLYLNKWNEIALLNLLTLSESIAMSNTTYVSTRLIGLVGWLPCLSSLFIYLSIFVYPPPEIVGPAIVLHIGGSQVPAAVAQHPQSVPALDIGPVLGLRCRQQRVLPADAAQ